MTTTAKYEQVFGGVTFTDNELGRLKRAAEALARTEGGNWREQDIARSQVWEAINLARPGNDEARRTALYAYVNLHRGNVSFWNRVDHVKVPS